MVWFFTSKTEGFQFYFLNVWLSSGQYTQIFGPNYLMRAVGVNGKVSMVSRVLFFLQSSLFRRL